MIATRNVVYMLAVVVGTLVGTIAQPSYGSPKGHPGTPPVLTEPFVPGDCPADRAGRGTTRGALACAQHRVLRTDSVINGLAKSIFAELRPATREFVSAEIAWLRFRQQSCKSESSIYQGGSAQPIAFAACLGDRNVQHTRELRRFLKVLKRR